MIGKTLVHYQIIEKPGEGVMGMIYKAEDTKLKRAVALKFLPQPLASNPVLLGGSAQEARAASSLKHLRNKPIAKRNKQGKRSEAS